MVVIKSGKAERGGNGGPVPPGARQPEAFADKLMDGFEDRPGINLLVFGVILPAAALVAELVNRFCAELFFDPLPTPLHILLVALVPGANLWVWLALRRRIPGRPRLLAWLNGAALGISLFYSLIFLPILPFGLLGVIVFGLGLLVLSPLFSLAVAASLRRRLSRGFPARAPLPAPGPWPGLLVALGLLVVAELPSTLTRAGVKMAASEAAETRARGLRLLRVFGHEASLLRLCYAWPSRATDITGFLLSFGEPVGTEKAREIYYRVMGAPFNSVPAPEKKPPGFLGFGGFDAERGGTEVAGVVPGLALSASRIDASIDAQAALGYQEWTLEFANAGKEMAEARAQIQLPPDGVVSRLTLWVNGEEREAAFAAKGQVRQAYENVVRARRDPVLVTVMGEDRVLMQCFPVPADGGRMKVRIGITAPLAFTSAGEAHVHLPRFAERNFAAGEGEVHSLWLESNEPFTQPDADWEAEQGDGGAHALRGRRTEAWLAEGRSLAVATGSGNLTAWTGPSDRLGKAFIQQWAGTAIREPLGKLTVAVDGSRGMRPWIRDVSEALRRADRPLRVVLATSEEVREYEGPAQRAGDWLERQPMIGGQDNIPALRRALERTPEGGAVLWIHAPQPQALTSPEILRQDLERRREGARLISLQLGNGPDRLSESLEGLPRFSGERLTGRLQEELGALLSPEPGVRTVLHRKKIPAGKGAGMGKLASDHLARLHAHAQILELVAAGREPEREAAVAMASMFQLVTPVTGAVVLENAAQFQAAGLAPAGAATVPGIPEPETWALLAVIAAVFLHQARARLLARRRMSA